MTKDTISLTLSKDEALVLFEWLAGREETGSEPPAPSAEERVLWNLEAQLEKALAEPLSPDYQSLLT